MSKLNSDYVSQSFYFDYLMGGRLSGVINVIERNFVISEKDILLRRLAGKNQYIPRDLLSGHEFLHDFGSGWLVDEDENSAKDRLCKNMQDSINKYQHLGEKTLALLGGVQNVALLYYGIEKEEKWTCLRETLKSKFGRDFIIVNLIEMNDPPVILEGIVTLQVDDLHSPKIGTQYAWQGWNQSWEEALRKLKLN